MQYFPLFIDTHELPVLVVGGGDVAARKLELLCRTYARVRVIALEACDEVRALGATGKIDLSERAVSDGDIRDVQLAYLATNDEALNVRLAAVARSRGILANVVDNPAHCRFITPSIVDRGRLVVAISTAGAAPVFARDIRARLEAWLPPSLAPLFDFIAERRVQVQNRLDSVPERRRFWERFFTLNGDRFDGNTQDHFDDAFENIAAQGELLLIDEDTSPRLLPIAAMAMLQRLDCIASNLTVPMELNELLRRDADRAAQPAIGELEHWLASGKRVLVYAAAADIKALRAHFPQARHLRAGAL